jgi:hypothetical protein
MINITQPYRPPRPNTDIALRYIYVYFFHRLCGLMIDFLAVNPEVSGSIPGAARFSD